MSYKSKYVYGKCKILKNGKIVSEEELLEYLREFYRENGRVSVAIDFNKNTRYPPVWVYFKVFGSWDRAIELAGLKEKKITKIRTHKYTKEELLKFLLQFYKIEGRPPTEADFVSNHKYPSFSTYVRIFDSWQNALKLVGLNIDSMVKNGSTENEIQKGRLFELTIKEEHFLGESIDLSGKNCLSPYDGICPKGQIYDAKSSKFLKRKCWQLTFNNTNKDEIQWYYLGLFDENFEKLLHILRIPSWEFIEEIEKGFMYIYLNGRHKYTIENMREYDITEKI